MISEHNGRDSDINAMGTIISAVGCTASCSAIPFTGALHCTNEGVVQIRYQKDDDPTWIEDSILPPFICSSEACCSEYIASNITIYFHVDGDHVGLAFSSATPTGDLLLGSGIAAILIGVFCAITLVIYSNKIKSDMQYTPV